MNINRAKNGHVKLWLKINNSDLAQDNNAYLVFVKMLFLAHYGDEFTSIRFMGKQYKLKAGEFSASIGELSILVNLPVSTLRKVIDRLVEDKRISKRTDRQTTVFSICNWSIYQGDQRRRLANGRANDVANDMANDVANVTEGKKNIKKLKNIHISKVDSEELLATLNMITKRSFRILPKSASVTVEKFSLDEITTALSKMMNDPWHKPKADTLSSEYMLRVSTIDKFLSANDTASKFKKTFGEPIERIGADKLNLSRKQLAALEYQ